MKDVLQAIHFHYIVSPFRFRNRTEVKYFLFKQLKKEGKKVKAINYIFCNDSYLQQINQQYLNHDTLTDIITFELSLKAQPLLADIYISVERVKENASLFNTSFNNELHRVIFHGALHLAGYKDKTKMDLEQMRKKENDWLQAYFVSRDTVSP